MYDYSVFTQMDKDKLNSIVVCIRIGLVTSAVSGDSLNKINSML
jgi:hypothetical protein